MGKHPVLCRLATAVLLAVSMALSVECRAGTWPQRTVRIINGPLAAGSSIDATARVLAEELSKTWKQSVVVETRPGADGIYFGQSPVTGTRRPLTPVHHA
jgi:tripartite-type tricarboxylate transporter receptor subunit TctC